MFLEERKPREYLTTGLLLQMLMIFRKQREIRKQNYYKDQSNLFKMNPNQMNSLTRNLKDLMTTMLMNGRI